MNSQYQHAYCQVSGTPFEQGVQQGQELSDAIRRNLASVHRKLEQEKVDLQAYQAFVNQNLRFFQEQRPEMYEELQGIAQGSGLPLDDILLLNIPAYSLCESFRHITQECSMLCVRGQAAADGCTYIIKNRDMGMPMEQALVRHIYPDGQEIIEVGGAGILTYPAVGINSHGLAVTTTGFWTEKDPTRIDRVEEADIFLNVRVLLSSCRTAAQAVEFCRTAPRMNGLNVIAADPTEAYVIEMTSDEIIETMRPEELPDKARMDLTAILRDADLVKFAKATPEAEQNEADYLKAYYFVEETKPVEEEAPAEEESPKQN